MSSLGILIKKKNPARLAPGAIYCVSRYERRALHDTWAGQATLHAGHAWHHHYRSYSADSVHFVMVRASCASVYLTLRRGRGMSGGHWRMRHKPVYMLQLLLGAVHTTGNLQGLVKMSNKEITQQCWSERYRLASLPLMFAPRWNNVTISPV